MAALIGTAMRHTVTGTPPDAAVTDLVAEASEAAAMLARDVEPVGAGELLARAEAHWRHADPADLDYAQRQSAADLLRAALDRCAGPPGPAPARLTTGVVGRPAPSRSPAHRARGRDSRLGDVVG